MSHRVVVGAGSQGRVVLEAWRAQHPSSVFHFVDSDPLLQKQKILDTPVDAPSFLRDLQVDEVVLAIGDNRIRENLASELRGREIRWGTVVHPRAVVSASAVIGTGSVILANAVVHTGARVGSHVVVNTGVVIEHDCVVEEFASLSPGVCMAGRVRVGRRAFLSVGVILAPRASVGNDTVIGAGSVVIKEVPASVVAYGNPARIVRAARESDFARVL